MSIIFSKKCELGLQAILFLSVQEPGSYINSDVISENLRIPKDFAAKVLQDLVSTGIIDSKKGKTGGFLLIKEPSSVTLLDLVYAMDGNEFFSKCMLGFHKCSDKNPCPVHQKWGRLRERIRRLLANTSLANVNNVTIKKIKSIVEMK